MSTLQWYDYIHKVRALCSRTFTATSFSLRTPNVNVSSIGISYFHSCYHRAATSCIVLLIRFTGTLSEQSLPVDWSISAATDAACTRRVRICIQYSHREPWSRGSERDLCGERRDTTLCSGGIFDYTFSVCITRTDDWVYVCARNGIDVTMTSDSRVKYICFTYRLPIARSIPWHD